jgi:translation initiation factor eIF-2B subunit delta
MSDPTPADPPAIQKSKSELREQRRLKQEQDQVAKLQSKIAESSLKKQNSASGSTSSGASTPKRVSITPNFASSPASSTGTMQGFTKPPAVVVTSSSASDSATTARKSGNKSGTSTKPYKKIPKPPLDTSDIHPCILRLGQQYKNRSIQGGNARCIAMLQALKELICDYHTPPNKTIERDLVPYLNKPIQYLINCRKLSISMGNAISSLKYKVHQLSTSNACLTEETFKKEIVKSIDMFIFERIVFADRYITEHGVSKIADDDVIMIYGRSSVVEMILKAAKNEGKKFSVVAVDSRPASEGQALAFRLAAVGIPCTYVLLTGISSVISQVNKVFIGAAAVLTNGSVYSRMGTALVCMMASEFHKPVLCCAETYKFTDKTWLNSLTSNEEGDPNCLLPVDGETTTNPDEVVVAVSDDWKNIANLKLSNMQYDLTPHYYISMLITEVGMIPPTSVPVIIREYHLKVGEP